jgi:prephenate dehydratase
MSTRVAYLGPKGTYAEKAAKALSVLEKLDSPQFLPCKGLVSVVDNLANNLCEAAVVPIENSVEGGVTSTLDSLWRNKTLFIHRAVVLPIKHSLMSSGTISTISEVLSHPQAIAQCSQWLNNNLPNAVHLPTNSTAEAIRMVKDSSFRAAIGSKDACHDLNILAYPINDIEGNCTRFVLLSKNDIKTDGNKASIAFSLKSNSPGALLKALNFIANLGLNMSRIESRPSKRELGEYIFFIDLDLDNSNKNDLEKVIDKLSPLCNQIINFGCYFGSEVE